MQRRSWTIVLTLVCLAKITHSSNVQTTAEKALIRDLLGRYKRFGVIGRPVHDSRVQMRVEYGLQLIQILGLDENKQVLRTNCWTVYRWKDALLRWNMSEYDGIKVIRVFPHQIWTPDINLYNFADERLQESREAGLLVYNDGSILWLQQVLLKSTCQVEITYFPFDNQVCMLEFGSFTHDRTLLELDWWTPDYSDSPMPYVDFSDYIPANDWFTDGEEESHLKHENRTKQIRSVKRYRVRYVTEGDRKLERHYPVLRFLIRLRRNSSFHMFILVVPCILLSLLALVVFWLPPGSSAKMSLGINIFVAFFVLLLLLAESMPSAVKNFPLIGMFFIINMGMVTLSTFLTTMVVNLFYRGTNGEPPPLWVRRLIIDRLGRILQIRQNIPLDERKSSTGLEAAHMMLFGLTWKKLIIDTDLPVPASSGQKPKLRKSISRFGKPQPDGNRTAAFDELCENASSIKLAVQRLEQRQLGTSHNQLVAMEWRTLASVIDRLFFLCYPVIMGSILMAVVFNTHVIDTAEVMMNRKSIDLPDVR